MPRKDDEGNVDWKGEENKDIPKAFPPRIQIRITETTLNELVRAVRYGREKGWDFVEVESEHSLYVFSIGLETKPNTHESLGYRPREPRRK